MKYRLEATRVTADADAEMVAPHSLDVTCKRLAGIVPDCRHPKVKCRERRFAGTDPGDITSFRK